MFHWMANGSFSPAATGRMVSVVVISTFHMTLKKDGVNLITWEAGSTATSGNHSPLYLPTKEIFISPAAVMVVMAGAIFMLLICWQMEAGVIPKIWDQPSTPQPTKQNLSCMQITRPFILFPMVYLAMAMLIFSLHAKMNQENSEHRKISDTPSIPLKQMALW